MYLIRWIGNVKFSIYSLADGWYPDEFDYIINSKYISHLFSHEFVEKHFTFSELNNNHLISYNSLMLHRSVQNVRNHCNNFRKEIGVTRMRMMSR